jgi:hypothetical protein
MADADTPTPNGEQLQNADPSPVDVPLEDVQPAAEQSADEPQVASTVVVPATPAAPAPIVAAAPASDSPSGDGGGEWDLLVSKVQSTAPCWPCWTASPCCPA